MTHQLVREIVDRVATARWQKLGSPPGQLDAVKSAILKEVDVPIYVARLSDRNNEKAGSSGKQVTLSEALTAAEKWEKQSDDRKAAVLNCLVAGHHDVRFMLQCYEFYEAKGLLGKARPSAEEEDGPQPVAGHWPEPDPEPAYWPEPPDQHNH